MRSAVCRILALTVLIGAQLQTGGVALAGPPQEPAAKSKLSPDNLRFDLAEQGLKALWRQDVVAQAQEPLQALYCSGNMVIAETVRNRIFCIDAKIGTWEGTKALRRPLQRPPCDSAQGELLITIGTSFHQLTVKTGEMTPGWRAGLAPYAAPLLTGQTVVLADGAGRISAVGLHDGNRKWLSMVHGPIGEQPVVAGDKVFASGFGDRVLAVELYGGRECWMWEPKAPAQISSGVAVQNDSVYVGDTGGHVYALSADVGSVRWQALADSCVVGRPRCMGNKLLVLTKKPSLTCFESNGEAKTAWSCPGATGIVALDERTVHVLMPENRVAGVSMKTGQVLWTDTLPSDCMIVENQDGTAFYVANAAGAIVAFGTLAQ
jgi:outer membrane protein assembly factor BamB